jgi:hypothetical protein
VISKCGLSRIIKIIKIMYTLITFNFLIDIVGGGVQLGPLGTAATYRPIVSAPGDYDDGKIGGIMIDRGN